MLVCLHQHVVVRLLHDQQDDLHKVEEAEILLSPLVSQQNKLHYVLQVVLVGNVLDILQMGQNLHQFVPNCVREVLCVLDLVDFQKLLGHLFVNFLEVFYMFAPVWGTPDALR